MSGDKSTRIFTDCCFCQYLSGRAVTAAVGAGKLKRNTASTERDNVGPDVGLVMAVSECVNLLAEYRGDDS